MFIHIYLTKYIAFKISKDLGLTVCTECHNLLMLPSEGTAVISSELECFCLCIFYATTYDWLHK